MPSPEAIQAVDEARREMDAAADAIRNLVESNNRPDDYYDKHRAAGDRLRAAIQRFYTAVGKAHDED